MPQRDKWDQYVEGGTAVADKWEQYAEPSESDAELTKKTQATAQAAGVGKPAPVKQPKFADLAGASEQPLGAPISPAGAAASLPRAAVGLAGGYGAGKLADVFTKNPWLHDAAVLTGSLVSEATASGLADAHPVVRGVARDVANKYVGKTAADAILPPPPEPTPDIEAEATQQATKEKALRTAREKAGLRRPQSEIDAERAAKAQDAAYQKDAEERMAIQKRADDTQSARMEAEKAAKNARLKAESDHAKSLADIEKARQFELTAQAKVRQIQEQMDAADRAKDEKSLASLKSQMADAEKEANTAAAQKERLRTMHSDDLMRRGKEQESLDAAAEAAAKEEDAAKEEVVKRSAKPPVARPSDSGVRPTESEQFLTRLVKKPLISLEDDAQGRRYFGKKWYLQQGEGHMARVNRLLGDVRSGRSARGMADTSIGPMAPPPAP